MRWIAAIVASAALMVSSAQAGVGQVIVEKETVIASTPVTALTLEQACCTLGSLPPGKHQITFIHPHTCCPVTVCFCLPCGCYKVECDGGLCAEKLRFSYPGLFNDVVIKFKKNGSVVVK